MGRVQFSSFAQSCPTLCDIVDCSMPGPPVLYQLSEFNSHSYPSRRWCHPTISSSVFPFSSCLQSFPHQGLLRWVSSSHQVNKVLEFQLKHQSFQWIFKTDLLENGLVGSPCSPRDREIDKISLPERDDSKNFGVHYKNFAKKKKTQRVFSLPNQEKIECTHIAL